MVRVKKRKNKRCNSNSAFRLFKPVIFGIAAAIIISLLFIMLFAIVFVIMKSIVSSAIIPLSLFAIIIGCFVGAFICATISRARGFIYGLVIGLILFAVVWLLSIAMGDEYFGSLLIIKLICLLAAGGFGGWIGSNHAHTRRKTNRSFSR